MSWTAGRCDGGLRFVTGACQERDAATKNRLPSRAGLISLCEKATDLCDWERRTNRKSQANGSQEHRSVARSPLKWLIMLAGQKLGGVEHRQLEDVCVFFEGGMEWGLGDGVVFGWGALT